MHIWKPKTNGQSGANSAFHEAVGDSIVYAAMATQHRRRLGFPPIASGGSVPPEVAHLLHQALNKVCSMITQFNPIHFTFNHNAICDLNLQLK